MTGADARRPMFHAELGGNFEAEAWLQDQRVDIRRQQLSESGLDPRRARREHGMDCNLGRPASGLDALKELLREWIVGVAQDADAPGSRQKLAQEFDVLGGDFGSGRGGTRDIATRAGKALDDSCADRIA